MADVIRPQPGPQTQFLTSSDDIAVYGGAAGGGKTFALLLEPLRNVVNPKFQGVIFRRTLEEVKNKGGLWDESLNLYPVLGGVGRESDLEWRFPSGASIRFEHLQHEQSKFRYQGAQFAFVGFDELTHFTESQFFYMLSRNRSTSGVKPYIRATTNPDAKSWVKDFLAPWISGEAGPGEARWMLREDNKILWLPRPAERCLKVGFYPARLADNQILLTKNPEYLASLKAMGFVDRRRLLEGDWDVVEEGNMFRREWFRTVEAAPTKLRCVRYWDLAGTEANGRNDPDYTVGALLGQGSERLFTVLDIQRVRATAGQVEALVRQTAEMDAREFECRSIRMEQEPGSSGAAVIERYAKEILAGFDFRGVRNSGSKVDRARGLSSQAEVGNIALVHAAWNRALLDEFSLFPAGNHDDQVDAVSGAFTALTTFQPFYAVGGGDRRGEFEPR